MQMCTISLHAALHNFTMVVLGLQDGIITLKYTPVTHTQWKCFVYVDILCYIFCVIYSVLGTILSYL